MGKTKSDKGAAAAKAAPAEATDEAPVEAAPLLAGARRVLPRRSGAPPRRSLRPAHSTEAGKEERATGSFDSPTLKPTGEKNPQKEELGGTKVTDLAALGPASPPFA